MTLEELSSKLEQKETKQNVPRELREGYFNKFYRLLSSEVQALNLLTNGQIPPSFKADNFLFIINDQIMLSISFETKTIKIIKSTSGDPNKEKTIGIVFNKQVTSKQITMFNKALYLIGLKFQFPLEIASDNY